MSTAPLHPLDDAAATLRRRWAHHLALAAVALLPAAALAWWAPSVPGFAPFASLGIAVLGDVAVALLALDARLSRSGARGPAAAFRVLGSRLPTQLNAAVGRCLLAVAAAFVAGGLVVLLCQVRPLWQFVVDHSVDPNRLRDRFRDGLGFGAAHAVFLATFAVPLAVALERPPGAPAAFHRSFALWRGAPRVVAGTVLPAWVALRLLEAVLRDFLDAVTHTPAPAANLVMLAVRAAALPAIAALTLAAYDHAARSLLGPSATAAATPPAA